jgi:hypothetical protein
VRYASTKDIDGTETVAVVLGLEQVPLWDSGNPLPGTFLVPDEVQVGWVMEGGMFVQPQEVQE